MRAVDREGSIPPPATNITTNEESAVEELRERLALIKVCREAGSAMELKAMVAWEARARIENYWSGLAEPVWWATNVLNK